MDAAIHLTHACEIWSEGNDWQFSKPTGKYAEVLAGEVRDFVGNTLFAGTVQSGKDSGSKHTIFTIKTGATGGGESPLPTLLPPNVGGGEAGSVPHGFHVSRERFSIMVSVVFCGGEIVRIFAPTATAKARDLYHTLFRSGMGRSVELVEIWMNWEYFISPPCEWETVYVNSSPVSKTGFYRTRELAELGALRENYPAEITTRTVVMEW